MNPWGELDTFNNLYFIFVHIRQVYMMISMQIHIVKVEVVEEEKIIQ